LLSKKFVTRRIAPDLSLCSSHASGLDGIRSNAIIVGFTPTGGEIMDKW
jgi:hypothetical protein